MMVEKLEPNEIIEYICNKANHRTEKDTHKKNKLQHK